MTSLVSEKDLDLLAYFYSGTGVPGNEDTMSSIILGTSMLTGRGVPVAGEYRGQERDRHEDHGPPRQGGSFTEYYAMDFALDVVLMGHDGPGHIGIAQDRIKVRPLKVYHGKVGAGLSVEMSVKHGPVTLLSVVEEANWLQSPGRGRRECARTHSRNRQHQQPLQIPVGCAQIRRGLELPWSGASLRYRSRACCCPNRKSRQLAATALCPRLLMHRESAAIGPPSTSLWRPSPHNRSAVEDLRFSGPA